MEQGMGSSAEQENRVSSESWYWGVGSVRKLLLANALPVLHNPRLPARFHYCLPLEVAYEDGQSHIHTRQMCTP